MEIRLLNEDDLESLMELYIQLDEDNKTNSIQKSKEVWKQIRSYNNIIYIGAVDNNKVVSTCYLVVIPNLTVDGRSIGFIENVVTDKNYRRKGIGRKVIEMAIQIAKSNNCYKVILQSGIKRTEAHQFYKNIGFDDNTKKAFDLRLE